ncbi:MAG: dTMP kinase [Candidatus Riflebacteria bacterium]|nr:dTMP kinase [Candidatus Riflebacteria bacterium]
MTARYFITFEGPEGSGKSTQIKKLQQFFAEKGFETLVSREPGGTKPGDAIREVLISKSSGKLEAETEMFLMLAQRCEHLRKVINPALEAGKVVLCDRYFDSSVAYQGYGRGLGAKKVRKAHEEFLGDFLPSLTILLQIPPADGLKRANHGGTKQLDRMECEELSFHERVFDGYNEMAEKEPERIVKVDAVGNPDDISKRIIAAVLKRFPELA